jgi:hypothetical protein
VIAVTEDISVHHSPSLSKVVARPYEKEGCSSVRFRLPWSTADD